MAATTTLQTVMVVLLVVVVSYYIVNRTDKFEEQMLEEKVNELGSSFIKYVANFKNQQPKNVLLTLMNEFGEPTKFLNVEGGYVMWENQSFFTNLIIKDEDVAHMLPYNHSDFLYVVFPYRLNPPIIHAVLKLSESIYYDRLKGLVTIRCGSMPCLLITALTVLEMNKMDVSQAQDVVLDFGFTMDRSLKNLNEESYDNIKKYIEFTVAEQQK